MTTKHETYQADGDVRGICGHKHRTIGAAARCVQADERDCECAGVYSDRIVVRTDGNDLSEYELDMIHSFGQI